MATHKLCVITQCSILQLVGLTATVGIGAAKGHPEAVAFIKEMCASIDLESQPTAVVAHKEELELSYYSPSEGNVGKVALCLSMES